MRKFPLGALAASWLLCHMSSFRIDRKKRRKQSSQHIVNEKGLNVIDALNSADNFNKADERPAHEQKSSADLSLVVQSASTHVVEPATTVRHQGGYTMKQWNAQTRNHEVSIDNGDSISFGQPSQPWWQLCNGCTDSPPITPPITPRDGLAEQLQPDMQSERLPTCPRPTPVRKLGEGAYGVVYLGRMGPGFRPQGVQVTKVAIKTETISRVGSHRPTPLENEAQVLLELQGGEGIPELYGFMRESSDENWMISQLFERDLMGGVKHVKLQGDGQHRFTGIVKQHDVGKYATKMLNVLEYVHRKKGIVHCDLKPGNMMALGSDLYIIDWGEAHHIDKPGDRIKGTILFMSKFAMGGHPIGYRDDVLSVLYSLLFMTRRKSRATGETEAPLPWFDASAQKGIEPNTPPWNHIRQMKEHQKGLFDGLDKRVATPFELAIAHCHGLSSHSEPVNYAYLRALFKHVTMLADQANRSKAESLPWDDDD